MTLKKALISVSDKRNIIPFAQFLIENGYEILSTGGTKKALEAQGLQVTSISDYTNFQEILDGRVKSLHPKIHAGLLARRDKSTHIATLKEQQIELIDLLVVNLYPFEDTIKNNETTKNEAIEQIDIGGPALIRSAAKNHDAVTVLTSYLDFDLVQNEIEKFGDTSLDTRTYLAAKAFQMTSLYDQNIANYLSKNQNKTISLTKKETLRYGENPHQKGELYQDLVQDDPYSIFHAKLLNGKQLSYNNIQDANAAINILAEFDEPCAVAVKHMNPCGVATSKNIENAYIKAFSSDPISIFGGIIALNREVTRSLAHLLNETFLEVIIAPSFTDEALQILKTKKSLRVLTLDMKNPSITHQQIVSINGGILIQDVDHYKIGEEDLEIVTQKDIAKDTIAELLFAWRVVKHVKSNAIVITKQKQTVGVGAGQMNRIGAARIALTWAKQQGHDKDLILASDAFFPFADVIELSYQYGVKAIIQPGGSIKDQDSIDRANALGIDMVFTKIRHFKH
jgi:phosphoribosylaminoimidazolecarboxamide formyltransferase / IMP cyclohydrolase